MRVLVSTVFLLGSFFANAEFQQVQNTYLGPVDASELENIVYNERCVDSKMRPSMATEIVVGIGAAVEVVNGVEILMDKLQRIGEKFFNLIGQGSIDPCFRDKVVHVLPGGVSKDTMFSHMHGWDKPRGERFQLSVKSGTTGRTVVEFEYMVVATTKGQVNGRGAYLANVHILPVGEPDVSFRWRFDASVSYLEPFNRAKEGQDPEAAIEMSLNYVADPILFGSSRSGVVGFVIEGNGNIEQIGVN